MMEIGALVSDLRALIDDDYYRDPIFNSVQVDGQGVRHPVQEWTSLAYARGMLKEIGKIVKLMEREL